jgi:hypothetical protein
VALALLQGRLSRSSLGVNRVPALRPSPWQGRRSG